MTARGRKPGTVVPNSNNAKLMALEIGESFCRETELSAWSNDMSVLNTPRSRRPAAMREREFVAKLYTCVGSKAGDIIYIIKIERTK